MTTPTYPLRLTMPLRLVEGAKRLAAWKAKLPMVIERHIEKRAWKTRYCTCSACYWRRVHVEKILQGVLDRAGHPGDAPA